MCEGCYLGGPPTEMQLIKKGIGKLKPGIPKETTLELLNLLKITALPGITEKKNVQLQLSVLNTKKYT